MLRHNGTGAITDILRKKGLQKWNRHGTVSSTGTVSSKPPVVFVCVEVFRPSQPNGVMSSAVSLPNHTFTGQAVL